MSVSPKNLISRFHDLKIWQKHHDGIFKRSRRNSRESELDVMDGVGVLGSSPESSPEGSPLQNREETVLPCTPKTFEEILQEKLEEEDPPLQTASKPKRPYLKKGSGLIRYGLEPGAPSKFVTRNQNPRKRCESMRRSLEKPRIDAKPASSFVRECKLKNMKKTRPKSLTPTTNETRAPQSVKMTRECAPKSVSVTSSERSKPKMASMKEEETSRAIIPPVIRETKMNTRRNLDELKKSLDLTPLKMPSLNVQINAKWCKVNEVEQKKNVRFADAGDFYFNGVCDKIAPVKGTAENTEETDECVLGTAQKDKETYEGFRATFERLPGSSAFTPELGLRGEPNGQHSEQSLYEKQLEKELLLFEMLEEKAENSSFCSTNSSIMQLLANSPTKLRLGCTPNKFLLDSTPLKSIAENVPREHRPLIPEDPSLSADSLLMQIKLLLGQKLPREILNGDETDFDQPHRGVEIKDIEEDKIETVNENSPSPSPPESLDEESTKDIPVNSSCGRREVEKFSDEEEWSTNTDVSNTTVNTSDLDTSQSEAANKELKDATTNTIAGVQFREITPKSVSCNCSAEINKKLTELNKEIAAFRSDNAQLQEQRRQLQEEKIIFENQMKKLRKEFENEKIEALYNLEEDKKKLAKEKQVFERYAKDIRSQPNRKEREEISNLKIEVASLKETQKLKDTKNGTTQARLRSQIKQQEKEIGNLKDEVEKLTRENAKLVAQQKVNLRPSDTKIIHEINKNLSKIAKEAFKTRTVYNNRPNGDDIDNDEVDNAKEKSKISWQVGSRKKFNDKLEKDKKDVPQRLTKDGKIHIEPVDKSVTGNTKCDDIDDNPQEDSSAFVENSFDSLSRIDIEKNYEKVFGQATMAAEEKPDSSLGEVKKLGWSETILEDGSKEIRYDNGDVKTISPDGNYITKKYMNGDVREMILTEGVTKYMFRHDGSCHTTYADGTEIFEFPTGQIEKKYRDGKYEVQFPNGVVRAVFPNGTEEITYPDGTFVQVDQAGIKTLYLKNGQKEIHTENEKRREYPDGTVKLLYNDGRQETRYANGRIRIKDKDGILLTDTHAVQ